MSQKLPELSNINEILFFDNLALHYLVNDTPPVVLARVFVSSDSRLSGSLLGIMSAKQREIVHELMAASDDGDEEKNKQAESALVLIAQGIIERGHIEQKGKFFFGQEVEEGT